MTVGMKWSNNYHVHNVIGGLTLLFAFLLRMPGVEYSPVLPWIVTILFSYFLTNRLWYPIMFTGIFLGSFLFSWNDSMTLSLQVKLAKSLVTSVLFCCSGYLSHRIKPLPTLVYWISLMTVLIITGYLSFNQMDHRIGFIMFSATAIISFLSGVQNRKLDSIPNHLYFCWLPVYLLWVLSIYLFSLDPNSFKNTVSFLEKYLLHPYPVFLLVILVNSHLVRLVKELVEAEN